MALKFLDENNVGRTSDAIRAINYATMMRAEFGEPVVGMRDRLRQAWHAERVHVKDTKMLRLIASPDRSVQREQDEERRHRFGALGDIIDTLGLQRMNHPQDGDRKGETCCRAAEVRL